MKMRMRPAVVLIANKDTQCPEILCPEKFNANETTQKKELEYVKTDPKMTVPLSVFNCFWDVSIVDIRPMKLTQSFIVDFKDTETVPSHYESLDISNKLTFLEVIFVYAGETTRRL
jgi:hypothetical protein